jgi:hypothetical protein
MTTGRLFQISLLLATLLPFGMVALPHSAGVLAVITAISLLGGTHVMATGYLYTVPNAFIGIPRWRLTVVAAPLVLMAATFAALMTLPTWALGAYMLVYIHFGLWHFGRQNLGVVAFAARISHGRPMDAFERWSIMAGVVAGMCGAYTSFAPAMMLNTSYFPVDATWAAPFFSRLWYAGAAIYIAVIPAALIYLWINRARYDAPTLALYVTSIGFFVPMFLATDPLIAVSSWATAHGLQYLVFLTFHAGSQTRPSLGGIIPPIALIAMAGTGYLLWNTHPQWNEQLARIGFAAVLSINLAHYWVDMFMWRFRTPERRKWLAESYPFLAGPSAGPAAKVAHASG